MEAEAAEAEGGVVEGDVAMSEVAMADEEKKRWKATWRVGVAQGHVVG